MGYRERYLWDPELKQWRPDHEVIAKRPERHNDFDFNFKVYKSGFNHSLGGYCGSKADEQSLCSRIEDRTGDRPEFIGDAKLSNQGTRREY